MDLFIQNNIGDKEFLLAALTQNMSWIKKSFAVNNNLGSSKYKTSWNTWAADYPETTGYLLPTLIESSQVLKDENLYHLAERQVKYFENLQLKSGGFSVKSQSQETYVFDSAQIMLGLISLYKTNKKETILIMIEKCYIWLIGLLNDKGHFISSNYKKDYNPAYYARIAWPLFSAELLLDTKSDKSILLYQHLKSLLNTNATFNDCSFDGSAFAFTHNLIYCYRGLWESATLINDNELLSVLESNLVYITQKITKEKVFNGEYDNQWNTKKPFICTTGNAQLVVLLLSLFSKKKNEDFLKACHILIEPLIKQQSKWKLFNSGAVSSSIPVWGKYQRFKYTNWTQKFYADALIKMVSVL